MGTAQFRWCCGEFRWCSKECKKCELVTQEQLEAQREQRIRDRRLYKTWAVKNGLEVEGED